MPSGIHFCPGRVHLEGQLGFCFLFWCQVWPFHGPFWMPFGPFGRPFGLMLALWSPLWDQRCPVTRSGADLVGPSGGPWPKKGGPEAHLRQPFHVFLPLPLRTPVKSKHTSQRFLLLFWSRKGDSRSPRNPAQIAGTNQRRIRNLMNV